MGHVDVIGRVGALAVLLGVGGALAAPTAPAWADQDTASSSVSDTAAGDDASPSTQAPPTGPERSDDEDPAGDSPSVTVGSQRDEPADVPDVEDAEDPESDGDTEDLEPAPEVDDFESDGPGQPSGDLPARSRDRHSAPDREVAGSVPVDAVDEDVEPAVAPDGSPQPDAAAVDTDRVEEQAVVQALSLARIPGPPAPPEPPAPAPVAPVPMTTLTLMNLLGVDPIPGVPNSPVPELLWGLYRRTEAAAGEPAGAALAAAVQPASMEPIHLPLGFLMARYPAMQVGADFFAEVVTIANGTVVMNQKPVGWYPNVLDGVLMEGDVYVLLVEHGPPDTIADDRVVYITKLQIGVPVTYIDFSDPVGYTMIYPAPPGGIPSEILGAWPRDPWDPSIPEELRPDPDPDDPNDPNNPTDPGNPGDPGDPDDPGDPGDPGDPTDPDPEPGITEDFIEKRWEEFLDAVDWIPGAHHFLRGLSLGVNFAQLLNAIFEGDRDEVVDEISDLVEDIVSFVSWPFSAVVDDIAEPLIEAFANRLLTMFGWPRV